MSGHTYDNCWGYLEKTWKGRSRVSQSVSGMDQSWASLIFLGVQLSRTFKVTNCYLAVTLTEGTPSYFISAFPHPSFSIHLNTCFPSFRFQTEVQFVILSRWHLHFSAERILYFNLFISIFSYFFFFLVSVNFSLKCLSIVSIVSALFFFFRLLFSFLVSYYIFLHQELQTKGGLPPHSYSKLYQVLGLIYRKEVNTELILFLYLHFSLFFTHLNLDLLRVSCLMFVFSYWNLLCSE